jgi:hypothetical protein
MQARIIAACLALVVAGCGGTLKSEGTKDSSEDTAVDTPGDTTADMREDAPADTPEDTTADAAPDVHVDTPAEIEEEAEEDVATEPVPECGTDGALLWGICWYLGSPGQSCMDVCGSHGGYADTTPQYVGVESQGGSLEECEQIFTALGYTGTVNAGYRDDGRGLGCHRWNDGVLWWLDSPAFDPTHSMDPASVACGCLE